MTYDVAIIGGGPAGSTAGIVLATAGRRVLILEREKFPRFHIGESLLPYTMQAFDRLGVREKMEERFMVKHGAEIASACGTREIRFHFKNAFRAKIPTAYQVTRSEFDKVLLDHAAERGAEVREETEVEKIDFANNGVTLHTLSADGAKKNISASYVIDATGRNSLLGTHFGLKKPYDGLKKFSVFAHFDNVERPEGINGTLTRMVRTSKSWFWMIPLTDTRTSIGLVMNQDDFKAAKKSPERMLMDTIAEQPVMRARMEGATRVTQVYATGDYSYRNARLTGDRWILTGDAAGFIDPVFSSGVFLAILSAEKAADALNQVINHPEKREKLFAEYSRSVNKVMDVYLHFVLGWYTQPFIETFLNPTKRFQMVPAINAILAGQDGSSFAIKWRLWLFYIVVWLQKRFALSPRLTLEPGGYGQPAPQIQTV
ncbi:MAG TPA: NAD(P)/FAD-dependent oxidoreductase [Chthoniobacterales bacterium]